MSTIDDPTMELNSIEGILDEIKEEQMTPNQKMRILTNFIGGFENWSELNEDCRLHIVGFLENKWRCNLERCSKQDQITVKNTPIHVDNMAIFDSDRLPDMYNVEPFDNVQVEFEFGNSTRHYCLTFSQDGEDTKRQWLKYVPGKGLKVQTLIIKSTNYYEEAVKFAEGFMKKGSFELDRMRTNMSKYPIETSKIRTMPFCTDARIGVNSLEQLGWWLSKLPENMKILKLYPTGEDSEDFLFTSESLDVPQVRTAGSLAILGRVNYTEEKVLAMRNRSIDLHDISISDEFINQFIKRWINGQCYKEFEQAHLGSMENRKIDVILNDIDVVEWDADFRDEVQVKTKFEVLEYRNFRGFFCSEFNRFCGSGDTYQISSLVNPFESLTLNVFYDGLYIYHTGKTTTRNGETYTDYYVPRGYW